MLTPFNEPQNISNNNKDTLSCIGIYIIDIWEQVNLPKFMSLKIVVTLFCFVLFEKLQLSRLHTMSLSTSICEILPIQRVGWEGTVILVKSRQLNESRTEANGQTYLLPRLWGLLSTLGTWFGRTRWFCRWFGVWLVLARRFGSRPRDTGCSLLRCWLPLFLDDGMTTG